MLEFHDLMHLDLSNKHFGGSPIYEFVGSLCKMEVPQSLLWYTFNLSSSWRQLNSTLLVINVSSLLYWVNKFNFKLFGKYKKINGFLHALCPFIGVDWLLRLTRKRNQLQKIKEILLKFIQNDVVDICVKLKHKTTSKF